jgi:hypothetical protein
MIVSTFVTVSETEDAIPRTSASALSLRVFTKVFRGWHASR